MRGSHASGRSRHRYDSELAGAAGEVEQSVHGLSEERMYAAEDGRPPRTEPADRFRRATRQLRRVLDVRDQRDRAHGQRPDDRTHGR